MLPGFNLGVFHPQSLVLVRQLIFDQPEWVTQGRELPPVSLKKIIAARKTRHRDKIPNKAGKKVA